MGRNKKVKNSKSKADKRVDEFETVLPSTIIKSESSDFDLIDNDETSTPAQKETTDPISIAMSILGCGRAVFTVAGDLRKKQPNAFYYNQYGVSLYFEEDEKAELFKVINHKSKPSSTAPAYWLIDKLVAETSGRLFFSPGREGIKR